MSTVGGGGSEWLPPAQQAFDSAAMSAENAATVSFGRRTSAPLTKR